MSSGSAQARGWDTLLISATVAISSKQQWTCIAVNYFSPRSQEHPCFRERQKGLLTFSHFCAVPLPPRVGSLGIEDGERRDSRQSTCWAGRRLALSMPRALQVTSTALALALGLAVPGGTIAPGKALENNI